LYGKFKKGKSLTTQVVRRSNFKKRRKGFIKGSIIRGAGEKDQKKKVQTSYAVKLLINKEKSPSSPLFFFFYTISHSFMLESLNWAQG
jgi:hypothetical protein